MTGKPMARRRADETLRDYGMRLVAHLRACAANAARRGNAVMCAHYLHMVEDISNNFPWSEGDFKIIQRAHFIERQAQHMCLRSTDATIGDKASWYAYSVYARMILRAAGVPCRGWTKWLKDEANKIDGGKA
jgi:hypothetical protein